MSTTASKLLTTADLLAMPDDGVERWIVKGELREKPSEFQELGMTVRNRFHSKITIKVGYLLTAWLETQPKPRGEVLGGEAGVRLRKDPDTAVGVDVVYVSAEMAANQPDDSTILVGVPVLMVGILSPNNRGRYRRQSRRLSRRRRPARLDDQPVRRNS